MADTDGPLGDARVLMLSTTDGGDGAGTAAFRLHRGLRRAQVHSSMLVCRRRSDDEHVRLARRPPGNRFSRRWREFDRFLEKWLNWFGLQNIYSVCSKGVKRNPLFRRADILHFQNIHAPADFFSLLLFNAAGQRPVFYTLHDMWAFTGHCYHAFDCSRWQEGCGHCPDLLSYIGIKYDTTAFMSKVKRFLYRRARPVVVTPSQWLGRLASGSPLFRDCAVHCIPNGVDQAVFHPHERRHVLREIMPAWENKYIVLFLSSFLHAPHRGFSHFEAAIRRVNRELRDVAVLSVGRGTLPEGFGGGIPVKNLGFIDDPHRLARVYSAADVYVTANLADNFPNVVLECLACGTPVTAFRTGGIPEMVSHLENGYLAGQGDARDLAAGIVALLSAPKRWQRLSENAVQTVSRHFSLERMVRGYIELYRERWGRA